MTRHHRTHKEREGGTGSGSSPGRGGRQENRSRRRDRTEPSGVTLEFGEGGIIPGESTNILALLLDATPFLGGEAGHLAKVRDIVGLFSPALAAWSMVHIFGDDGLPHMAAVIHPDKTLEHFTAELERRGPGAAFIAAVALSACTRLMPEPELTRALPDDERDRHVIEVLGAGPCIMVPMMSVRGVVGVLTFVGRCGGAPFDKTGVKIAEHVAALTGMIVEHGRLGEQLRLSEAGLSGREQKRMGELEEINRDLEAFSYSVSHDLRAPLRAIDGFARTVSDRYAGQLDPEGVRLLGIISSSTKKMGQLIDDLLLFAQVGRREVARTSVDMSEMAASVVHAMLEFEHDRTVDVRVDVLASAWANPSMVRQLLVNLISNALKFTRQQPHPFIEIGCVEGPVVNTYSVRDNGIGFDMRHAEKIFGVFQRLHGAGTFEGTGIGLALVRRIAVWHGGSVWAESKPDEGATFYFTLPAVGADGHGG